MASLKSFIKSVRKAKTIADERSVVQKESAAIRTSFRDPGLDQTTRRINISKLLYLYIMGEKTHFGQVECLKLLASPRFADKRLGYLACMLILDENQEVLTLLTNSLDNDMQHPNSFIVGLALCCLGNIASPELARDLYTNVETIIDSKNVYLKKKACIVAAKLIEKEPELAEFFITKINSLINEKQPSLLLGTIRLIQALYFASEESRPTLIKTIPKLVADLKRTTTSGYQPDYDVTGTTDPFLQVSLLETLRILGRDEQCPPQYLEQINDILTQVASNLDSGKNAAHAILYECVKTIFAIQSDQSLKILGVNILGKFLSTKDNNTRYVALDTLLTVVTIEPMAVQRHRSTIVNCLSDGDISIRRRALELSFGILNEQNIRVLAREILTFLEKCHDQELKSYVTSQLTIAANKYAPNDKWHFDTLIRMLKVGGNALTPDIISNILALILQCNDLELKKHVASKLVASCLETTNQYGLALITSWTMGEYGDLILGTNVEVNGKTIIITEQKLSQLIDDLINNTNFSESETIQLTSYILTSIIKLSIKFKDNQVIETLRLILNSKTHDPNLEIQTRAVEYQQIFGQLINNTNFSESETIQLTSYILTLIIKLSIKFKDNQVIETLRLILNSKTHDPNLEIQTRAVEYQQIFGQDSTLKRGLLARMPAPPVKQREALTLHKSANTTTTNTHKSLKKSTNETSGGGSGSDNLLLDLMDDIVSPATNQQQSSQQGDVISDIFGGGGGSGNDTNKSTINNAAILDLFNSSSNSINPAVSSVSEIPAFENNDVKISFIPKSFPQNGEATIEAIIRSKINDSNINQFQLLIAVPKSQKLTITSTSGGDSLIGSSNPNESIRQILKIVGKQGAKIKLRVKVKYNINNSNSVEEQFDFAGFKSNL
ncbi:AP-1 complex subunit gamma-1 [Candida albicans P37037]|nr:AP-1 complex subunit gamma-1 [Candida albicans P37037]